MTTEATTYAHEPERLPAGRLWFGTLAAAVAWVVHGIAGFFITWQACQDGDGDWGTLSEWGVRWLLGVLTLVLLATAAAACAVSFANWRRVAEQRRLSDAEGKGREEFLSLAGLFVGVAFCGGILWAGLGPLLLDVCVTAK